MSGMRTGLDQSMAQAVPHLAGQGQPPQLVQPARTRHPLVSQQLGSLLLSASSH